MVQKHQLVRPAETCPAVGKHSLGVRPHALPGWPCPNTARGSQPAADAAACRGLDLSSALQECLVAAQPPAECNKLASPEPCPGNTAPLSSWELMGFAAAWTGRAWLHISTGPEPEKPSLSDSASSFQGWWEMLRVLRSQGRHWQEPSSEDFKSHNCLSLCVCDKLKLGFADPTAVGPEEGLSYFSEERSKLN